MNSDFTCDLCPKTYTERRSLKRHKLLHEEKKFECNFCKNQFTRKFKLKNHVCNIKSDENKCLNCAKTFLNISNLKKHLKKCNAINYFEKEKSLTKELLLQTEDYKSQIEMGKMLANILISNVNIEEAVLNETHKKALYLYQSSVTHPFNEISLRS